MKQFKELNLPVLWLLSTNQSELKYTSDKLTSVLIYTKEWSYGHEKNLPQWNFHAPPQQNPKDRS